MLVSTAAAAEDLLLFNIFPIELQIKRASRLIRLIHQDTKAKHLEDDPHITFPLLSSNPPPSQPSLLQDVASRFAIITYAISKVMRSTSTRGFLYAFNCDLEYMHHVVQPLFDFLHDFPFYAPITLQLQYLYLQLGYAVLEHHIRLSQAEPDAYNLFLITLVKLRNHRVHLYQKFRNTIIHDEITLESRVEPPTTRTKRSPNEIIDDLQLSSVQYDDVDLFEYIIPRISPPNLNNPNNQAAPQYISGEWNYYTNSSQNPSNFYVTADCHSIYCQNLFTIWTNVIENNPLGAGRQLLMELHETNLLRDIRHYALLTADLYFEIPLHCNTSVRAAECYFKFLESTFTFARLGLVTKASNAFHFRSIQTCRTIFNHPNNLQGQQTFNLDTIRPLPSNPELERKYPLTALYCSILSLFFSNSVFQELSTTPSKPLVYSRQIARSISKMLITFIETIFDMKSQSTRQDENNNNNNNNNNDHLTLSPIFNPINHNVLHIFPSHGSQCSTQGVGAHGLSNYGKSVQLFISSSLLYLKRHDQFYLTEGSSGFGKFCLHISNFFPLDTGSDNRYNPQNVYHITNETVLRVDEKKMFDFSHVEVISANSIDIALQKNQILDRDCNNVDINTHTNNNTMNNDDDDDDGDDTISNATNNVNITINKNTTVMLNTKNVNDYNSISLKPLSPTRPVPLLQPPISSCDSTTPNTIPMVPTEPDLYHHLPYAAVLHAFVHHGQNYMANITSFFTNKEEALYTLYHHVESFNHTIRRAHMTARLFIYMHILATIPMDYWRSTQSIVPIIPPSTFTPLLTWFHHLVPEVRVLYSSSRLITRNAQTFALKRRLIPGIPNPIKSFRFAHPFYDYPQLCLSKTLYNAQHKKLSHPTTYPKGFLKNYDMYLSHDETDAVHSLYQFKYRHDDCGGKRYDFLDELGNNILKKEKNNSDETKIEPSSTSTTTTTITPIPSPSSSSSPNMINFLSTFQSVHEVIVEDFGVFLGWLAQNIGFTTPSYTNRLKLMTEFGIVPLLIQIQHRSELLQSPNSILPRQDTIANGLSSNRCGRVNNAILHGLTALFSKPLSALTNLANNTTCYSATMFIQPSTCVLEQGSTFLPFPSHGDNAGYYFFSTQNPYLTNIQRFNCFTLNSIRESNRQLVETALNDIYNIVTAGVNSKNTDQVDHDYNNSIINNLTRNEKNFFSSKSNISSLLDTMSNTIPTQIYAQAPTRNKNKHNNNMIDNIYHETLLDQIARSLFFSPIFFTFCNLPLIQYDLTTPSDLNRLYSTTGYVIPSKSLEMHTSTIINEDNCNLTNPKFKLSKKNNQLASNHPIATLVNSLISNYEAKNTDYQTNLLHQTPNVELLLKNQDDGMWIQRHHSRYVIPPFYGLGLLSATLSVTPEVIDAISNGTVMLNYDSFSGRDMVKLLTQHAISDIRLYLAPKDIVQIADFSGMTESCHQGPYTPPKLTPLTTFDASFDILGQCNGIPRTYALPLIRSPLNHNLTQSVYTKVSRGGDQMYDLNLPVTSITRGVLAPRCMKQLSTHTENDHPQQQPGKNNNLLQEQLHNGYPQQNDNNDSYPQQADDDNDDDDDDDNEEEQDNENDVVNHQQQDNGNENVQENDYNSIHSVVMTQLFQIFEFFQQLPGRFDQDPKLFLETLSLGQPAFISHHFLSEPIKSMTMMESQHYLKSQGRDVDIPNLINLVPKLQTMILNRYGNSVPSPVSPPTPSSTLHTNTQEEANCDQPHNILLTGLDDYFTPPSKLQFPLLTPEILSFQFKSMLSPTIFTITSIFTATYNDYCQNNPYLHNDRILLGLQKIPPSLILPVKNGGELPNDYGINSYDPLGQAGRLQYTTNTADHNGDGGEIPQWQLVVNRAIDHKREYINYNMISKEEPSILREFWQHRSLLEYAQYFHKFQYILQLSIGSIGDQIIDLVLYEGDIDV